jgi:hypothetical protein
MCPAQRPHILLVVAFFNNHGHAAWPKIDQLMRRTYNRGLTNPEYLRVLNKTYPTKEKIPRAW